MTRRRLPGAVRAFGLLLLFDAVLRLRGLQSGLGLARRLGAAVPTGDWDPAWTELVGRRVATAAAFYPRRALCLEQSLAMYVALRRAGAPVVLRIGVRPVPFAAHAWVELDGKAVNEPQDFIGQLVPFPGLGG
jgi:hypothetical protein